MADISKIKIEDGTYDIKDEVARNSIATINDNMDEITRNSKYVAYIYCEDVPRQSLTYIESLLRLSVEAGFKESQMTIHINSDGTIAEDKTKFTSYNDLANELNIPIKSVKIHGRYNYTLYMNNILDVLQYFPDATTCFIFNEQLEEVAQYGTTYPATIKNSFPNITKVGFTAPYNKCFYGNNMTPTLWNALIQNFDIMGVHMYPSCTTFDNPANCNYQNVINAFNQPQFICPWNKEIWITECGVLPYWQFLSGPENYNIALLTDVTKTTEPQRIFYRALNNCDMAQRAIKIIPWFIESGVSDPEHTLFTDILKNIIRGV